MFYLDESAQVTLGVCYERVPRCGGDAYHLILRRLEAFTDEPLRAAVKDHEKRATMVLDLEEKVAAAGKKLKECGLVSPTCARSWWHALNRCVGLRANRLHSKRCLRRCERATKFNVEKIRPQDLAGAAGPPGEEP